MQQNQQEHRFSHTSAQQPVYRFPQNQNTMGWQPQQSFAAQTQPQEEVRLSKQSKHELKKLHKRKRRKVFTLWNLFAVIGMITTFVHLARYVVIPALVYVNVLAGGVQ